MWPITATEKTHALARARTTWPWSRRLGDGRRDAGPASTSPPLSLLDLFIVVFDAKAKLVTQSSPLSVEQERERDKAVRGPRRVVKPPIERLGFFSSFLQLERLATLGPTRLSPTHSLPHKDAIDVKI